MNSRGGPILVTGGAGFIGCNLADRLARDGCRVRIYDALARPGVRDNLEWLLDRHGNLIEPVVADVRDVNALASAMRGVQAVFHFAAQVAVTTSLDAPRHDFEVNTAGTFNVLEAASREKRRVPVIFASTNKVYGNLASLSFEASTGGYRPCAPDLAAHGVGEDQPLDFHTPYGCSKGAADQYVLDYARSFGQPAVVLRMSCIYGARQKGTEDQGWVAHFLLQALKNEAITLYGDGHQVRDLLEVTDVVEAYVSAWQRIDDLSGRAFNIGGGPENSVSLLQVIGEIGSLLGRPVQLHRADWRAGDQRWFVADTRAAQKAFGFASRIGWREGVGRLAAEFRAGRTATRCLQPDLPEAKRKACL